MSALELWNEINTDPLTRGYSGMTDQQVADDMNTAYRSRNRTTMTASEIINSVNKAEYDALTVDEKGTFWDLLSIGDLNPFGVEATIMVDLFGGGSTTITTLQAQRVESITRAQELGLNVSAGTVAEARAQGGA